MGDAAHEPPISLYGDDADTGPRLGSHATCELCGRTTRCVEEHGFLACERCHRELLPGDGLLSSY